MCCPQFSLDKSSSAGSLVRQVLPAAMLASWPIEEMQFSWFSQTTWILVQLQKPCRFSDDDTISSEKKIYVYDEMIATSSKKV